MTSSESDLTAKPAARTAMTLSLVLLLVLGAALAFWGWRGGGTSDVALPTPTPVAVSEGPDRADEAQGTNENDAAATARPGAAPTRTRSPETRTDAGPTSGATATGVGGAPVHLRITRGTDVLVDAPVALTQLNDRDELNPPAGVVGWYGPPQWQTVPGELSSYPGVLAGHTTYDGSGDVFYRLGEVRAGDRVTIRYADGQEAVFEADADALSVPKNDVTEKAGTDYAWVWSLPEPGRKVSLFSCDLAEGRDLTGHSLNNWVVQATRTG